MARKPRRIDPRNTIIDILECTECGLEMFVPRKKTSMRQNGHIKTMWCVNCQKKTDFVEHTKGDTRW